MHNNIAVGAGLISLDVLIWDESLTLKQANEVIEKIDFVPKVFFFDRVSPAILKLATVFKEKTKDREVPSLVKYAKATKELQPIRIAALFIFLLIQAQGLLYLEPTARGCFRSEERINSFCRT